MPIEPGTTASLDHILPRSKYPHLQDEPTNLVWVHRDVNAMKDDADPLDDASPLFRVINPEIAARIKALAAAVKR
jgi:5-methylcytosine-specific restriction endonuclease McrA